MKTIKQLYLSLIERLSRKDEKQSEQERKLNQSYKRLMSELDSTMKQLEELERRRKR